MCRISYWNQRRKSSFYSKVLRSWIRRKKGKSLFKSRIKVEIKIKSNFGCAFAIEQARIQSVEYCFFLENLNNIYVLIIM